MSCCTDSQGFLNSSKHSLRKLPRIKLYGFFLFVLTSFSDQVRRSLCKILWNMMITRSSACTTRSKTQRNQCPIWDSVHINKAIHSLDPFFVILTFNILLLLLSSLNGIFCIFFSFVSSLRRISLISLMFNNFSLDSTKSACGCGKYE